MPDLSARLDLPLIKPSQAQKHVTHNEALQVLDGLVQAALEETGAETPPFEPVAGQLYALGANPTGDWTGQADKLALRLTEAWLFIAPREGWRAWDKAAGQFKVYGTGGWARLEPDLDNLDGVGIGTGSDPTNRLAVASEASLFTHAGAGHRMKVNKAGAAETASLLFQSNWTGHAEMGLTGGTAFSVKVSDDGAAWHEAFRADAAAQQVTIPFRIVGDAVQQSTDDATAERLMKVGAFGLGATDLGAVRLDDGETDLPSGFYAGGGSSADVNTFPNSNARYNPFLSLTRRITGGDYTQVRIFFADDGVFVMKRGDLASSWGQLHALYSRQNILGTVSQSGGVPTGAVIERGSNANGEYARFADGTQICTGVSQVDVTDDTFQSFPVAANFVDNDVPRAFVNHLTTVPNPALYFGNIQGITAGTGGIGLRLRSAGASIDPASDAEKLEFTAVGRWF